MFKKLNRWYTNRKLDRMYSSENAADRAREGCKAAHRGQVTIPLMPADVIEKRDKNA